MPDTDQDTNQDYTPYQLTGDDLSELHGFAQQLQAAGDPRADRVFNFIDAHSGGNPDPAAKGNVYRTPLKVTSWLDDLENTLWGDTGNAGAQSTQNTESPEDDSVDSGNSDTVPRSLVDGEAASSGGTGPQQTPIAAQDSSNLQIQKQPQDTQSNGQTQQQQAAANGTGGRRVHFIAYTVGNPDGDDDFKKAAETRARDFQNSKSFDPNRDVVLLYGLGSKDNFKWALEDAQKFGNIQELALFSHGGRNDGPIFHNAAGAEENLTKDEVAGLKINFTPSAHADFMACHTATNGFSQNFANAHKVLALGFAGTTFSGEPNQKSYGYKFGDREYMLGSEGFLNRAWHSVIGGDDLRGPQFFYPQQSK